MDFNEIFRIKYEEALADEGFIGCGKNPTVAFNFIRTSNGRWDLNVVIEKNNIKHETTYYDVKGKVMNGVINPREDVRCFKQNVLKSLLSDFVDK